MASDERTNGYPFRPGSPSPGRRFRKVGANREVSLTRIRILSAGKLPRGLERVSGNFSGLLYPGGNSFFRMKKRKLLARGGATSLQLAPANLITFRKPADYCRRNSLRNANISITIDGRGEEGGPPPASPFILSTIFSQVTRVSNSFGKTSRRRSRKLYAPILSSLD